MNTLIILLLAAPAYAHGGPDHGAHDWLPALLVALPAVKMFLTCWYATRKTRSRYPSVR